jgi:putative acetyltransferase
MVFTEKLMVTIREEKPGDEEQIRIVNQRAFGQNEEADIVDRLRQNCMDRISLVAVSRDQIIGHILFTPVTIQAEEKVVEGMGLAPMAVLPEFQRQGIGSKLVKAGLDIIKKAKHPFVIVLGHPAYYPLFGFVPASRYRIKSEYKNVPDETFMVLVLDPQALKGVSGVAKYRAEFGSAI